MKAISSFGVSVYFLLFCKYYYQIETNDPPFEFSAQEMKGGRVASNPPDDVPAWQLNEGNPHRSYPGASHLGLKCVTVCINNPTHNHTDKAR